MVIMVGSVVLLMLTVAKALFPSALTFLPLGGSTIAEMGIVFGTCVAIETLVSLA